MSDVEQWLEATVKPLTTLQRLMQIPDIRERYGALTSEYKRQFCEKLSLQEEVNQLKDEMGGMLGITWHKMPTFRLQWEDDPGPKECGAGRRNPAEQYLVVDAPGLYSIDMGELLDAMGVSEEHRAAGKTNVTVKGDEVWVEFY